MTTIDLIENYFVDVGVGYHAFRTTFVILRVGRVRSVLMLTRTVADGILRVSDRVWRCMGHSVDFWLRGTTVGH